jgi:hypothetical protein
MRVRFRLGLALAATVLFGLAPAARAKAIAIAVPQKPAAQAANADVVVVGKVTEIEADAVEATAFPGAPKDQKMSYKVAVLKADESLLGGAGLTRYRVGFPADAPPPGEPGAEKPGGPVPAGGPRGGLGRIRRPMMVVGLAAGMEGCFFLTRHHDGDFYVMVAGPPLLKKNENYAKELEQVKKTLKAIEDPVAALKAKELDARFQAAQTILQRYQTVRNQKPGVPPAREPIPEEENKLIVALLKELPWMPKDPAPGPTGEQKPSRAALWYQINPAESGFKDPMFPVQKPGDPPVDYNKIMDEATGKFLKESGEKIKIKRFASK